MKNITIATLALIIVFSPFTTFAKENNKDKKQKNSSESRKEQFRNNDRHDDDDDDDRSDRQRNKKNSHANKCIRAYGHFFSPGWNKQNTIDNDEREYFINNCYIPFGINKKFRGPNATTTLDVTAPLITRVTTNAGKVQADVRWMTNEYADSVVFWNTSNSIDTSDSAVNKFSNSRLTKSHQVIMRNLTPDTNYYIIIRSKDVSGNSSLSPVASFRTKIASTTDNQYPVISSVVTTVSTSTINIGWKTNENTTDRVYYSTTLPVMINASSTSYVSNASTTKTHALSLTNLSANTTYYLVIESTDTAGNVSTSATFSAKTNALPVVIDNTAPVLSSIIITPGASTSTISWITDELSTSKVFYSTSTPLDIIASTTQSVLNSALLTNHSISLSGLATSTIYYFKIQSVDTSGNTQTSGEVSTTTFAQ